jgi:hypothetical protein
LAGFFDPKGNFVCLSFLDRDKITGKSIVLWVDVLLSKAVTKEARWRIY